MRRYVSPLRYPGGKARLADYLAHVLESQSGQMDPEVWFEPFAGGLGAGLTLLDRGQVDYLWFCEANPGLAAFWRMVVDDADGLASRIEQVIPDLDTYGRAQEALASPALVDDGDLAMAAFLVNRCSRSGMVAPKVGPIGGRSQTGRWGVGARYNATALAERVRRLGRISHRMRFLSNDGLAALSSLKDSGIEDEVVVFADPPYVRQGGRLYDHGFTPQQHWSLAQALNDSPARWLLTYDAEPLILEDLYPNRRVVRFDATYTAATTRVGQEYLVLGSGLHVDPQRSVLPTGGFEWMRRLDLATA